MVRLIALALALVPILRVSGKPSGIGASPRPNIVIVMADDLGFADLGCYGGEIETPNLDALAKSGLRFTQFYNTAKCHSSRVSLLTGLYCDQAGGAKLTRGATIAEALSRAGYSTAMSGKWHLSRQPTDFGFQRYWGHLSGATNYFIGDQTFRLNGHPWEIPATLNGKPFYTTRAVTDFAIRFLDEMTAHDAPFFLYVAYNAPHYPLQAPKEAIAKYKGRYNQGWDKLRIARHARQLRSDLLPARWKLSPRPDHIPAWDSLTDAEKQWNTRRMEVYAAMVDILDQNIGRLVAHLEKSGVWDNTLFLFCSDNGACPFDRTRGREFDAWDPRSYWCYNVGWANLGNTPFRLYKQNQHEGGISSPLVTHWPANWKPKTPSLPADPTRRATPLGPVTDQPAHIIDFMATCLDLAGAPYPRTIGNRKIDPLQGLSLVPILQGRLRNPHATLYQHFANNRALRQGDWKLVSAKGGRWELYNIAEDRTELHDLAEDRREQTNRMAAEWFRIARDIDRLPPGQLKPVGKRLAPLRFGLVGCYGRAGRTR